MQMMVRKIELAQAQERLLIDFMAVAQNHLPRDKMLEWTERFKELHTQITTALEGKADSPNPQEKVSGPFNVRTLSVRTRKVVLRRLGLPYDTTVVDAEAIRSVSDTDWRAIRNCGQMTLDEIRRVFGYAV